MDEIVVRGGRTHNLKNITVTIPRDKLCVITGLSGSGKSSLAFDTLYAEGQRRYVESLSSYARQFLQLMDKPDVDSIEGLSPAISIEQKSTSHNPRSTVGTITEIHDYLRLLFARIGEARCPEHGTVLKAQTVSQMVDQTLTYPEGTKLMIMAPVVRGRKGEYKQLLGEIAQQGFIRVRIDGEIYSPNDPPELKLHIKHNIEVVVDRIKVRPDIKQRLADSFETALKVADGLAMIAPMDDHDPSEEVVLSARYSCPECGYSIPEIEPRNFSFNNPHGACPCCDGLGKLMVFSINKLIKDPEKSIEDGVIGLWDKTTWRFYRTLIPACEQAKIDISTPFKDLPYEQQMYILYGNPQGRKQNVNLKNPESIQAAWGGAAGAVGAADTDGADGAYGDADADGADGEAFAKNQSKKGLMVKIDGEMVAPDGSSDADLNDQDRLDEQMAQAALAQAKTKAKTKAKAKAKTKGKGQDAAAELGSDADAIEELDAEKLGIADTRALSISEIKALAKSQGSGKAKTIKHATAQQMQDMEAVAGSFQGVIPILERQVLDSESENYQALLQSYMVSEICPECHGARLKQEYCNVFVDNKTLPQINEMSIADAYEFFCNISLGKQDSQIAERILKEVRERLMFLKNVGLGYLTLARSAETLSGGEAQRIRLASQIGAGLVGVMYILDEPSIGLHQRDNQRLLDALKHLRNLGNTVIVVEHDEDAIRQADFIVDIGPGAGVHGGEIVTCGTPQEIMQCERSLTADYLTGRKQIAVPQIRHVAPQQRYLTLTGCHGNNLKDVDVSIPLGCFVVVTGVSGSGKSTLINDTLVPMVASHLKGSEGNTELQDQSFRCKTITGLEHIDKLICIDQSPIGRTPRSNPATYIGLFSGIRDLFAQTEGARARGYGPGRFSFNVKGGRCEACQGDGTIRVEMHFLPDVYVQCEQCHGQRYNRETLEIQYKGKNISDVLNMTVEEAYEFFSAIPPLKRKLQALMDVGLSYITLGQSALTFSGGEAQRIKLAKELSKVATKRTLYVLDEPTTGLHFHDVKQLLDMLQRLRDEGNTVLIIEHNLDVIKCADYIIDLGPEGGSGGGQIIATGTPEEIAMAPQSFTGQFLKPILQHAGTLNRAEAEAQTTGTSKAKSTRKKARNSKAANSTAATVEPTQSPSQNEVTTEVGVENEAKVTAVVTEVTEVKPAKRTRKKKTDATADSAAPADSSAASAASAASTATTAAAADKDSPAVSAVTEAVNKLRARSQANSKAKKPTKTKAN